MSGEIWKILQTWSSLDTWIVLTSVVVSLSCSVPGVFLLVRRQSMLGDTLSHTALPGITLGFLFAVWLRDQGWVSAADYPVARHLLLLGGAMVVGVLAALLTEVVQKLGEVEASAALGVVFTSLFALGLLLVRRFADQVDLDPECVLYGTIETTVTDTWGTTAVPRAFVVNGGLLAMNLVLSVAFFKELRLCAFDPPFAATLGIRPGVVHYALTAVTAATLVAAFESVGSILVIAMLVGPAATARLLTDRLSWMVVWSLVAAAVAAVLGHVSAITVPAVVASRVGLTGVTDASTAGMTAVACGFVWFVAALASPRYGWISRAARHLRLALQVAGQDLLAQLYRREETSRFPDDIPALPLSAAMQRIAATWLRWHGEIAPAAAGWQLTPVGRAHAEQLIRAHRLWESYLARHFELPQDHLHDSAERVEHYLDQELRGQLAAELADLAEDPHGRPIPSEKPGT